MPHQGHRPITILGPLQRGPPNGVRLGKPASVLTWPRSQDRVRVADCVGTTVPRGGAHGSGGPWRENHHVRNVPVIREDAEYR